MRQTARDHYGVETGLRYAYLCQACGHRWGLWRHQQHQPCPECGRRATRRYRPVAGFTRRQRAAIAAIGGGL